MADKPSKAFSMPHKTQQTMKEESEEDVQTDYGQILEVIKQPNQQSLDNHRKKFPLYFKIKLPRDAKIQTLSYEELREHHPYLLISYFQNRANIRESQDILATVHPKQQPSCKQQQLRQKSQCLFANQTQLQENQLLSEQQPEPIHHDYLDMRETSKSRPQSKPVQSTGCYDVFLGEESLQSTVAAGLIDCESVFADIGLTPFSSPVYFEPIKFTKASLKKISEEFEILSSRKQKLMIIY